MLNDRNHFFIEANELEIRNNQRCSLKAVISESMFW